MPNLGSGDTREELEKSGDAHIFPQGPNIPPFTSMKIFTEDVGNIISIHSTSREPSLRVHTWQLAEIFLCIPQVKGSYIIGFVKPKSTFVMQMPGLQELSSEPSSGRQGSERSYLSKSV